MELLAIIGGIVLFIFILGVVMWQTGVLTVNFEINKDDE